MILALVWCCTYFNVGDTNRVSLTEISLAPQEFDDYQIGVDAAITFCLKELRVISSILYSTRQTVHTCTHNISPTGTYNFIV